MMVSARRRRWPPSEGAAAGRSPVASQRAKREHRWLLQSSSQCPFPCADVVSSSTPHLAGRLDHQFQLRPLIGLGKIVALHGGGKAALRAQRQLLEWEHLCGLLDARAAAPACSPARRACCSPVPTPPSCSWEQIAAEQSRPNARRRTPAESGPPPAHERAARRSRHSRPRHTSGCDCCPGTDGWPASRPVCAAAAKQALSARSEAVSIDSVSTRSSFSIHSRHLGSRK